MFPSKQVDGQIAATVRNASEYRPNVFRNAIVGPDSLIYAIDLTQGIVVVFDSVFTRVRELRPDHGGRFTAPYALGFHDDTLWVSDVAARSVSLFAHGRDPAGTASNSVKPPTSETYFEVIGIAPTGDWWLDEGGSLSATGTMMRNGRAVALAGRGDSTPREVARLAARDLALIFSMPDGQVFVGTQPWTSTDLFDLASNSSWMTLVKRFDAAGGIGDSTVVELFDGAGRQKWRRALDFPQVAISDSLVGMAQTGLATPSVVTAYGSVAKARRAIREVLYVPDSLPAIGQVVITNDGEVWLAHTATTDVQLWTVLGPDGQVRRGIDIPAEIHVVDIADHWIVGIRENRNSRYQLVRLSVAPTPARSSTAAQHTATPSDSSPTVALAREAIARFFPTVLSDTTDPGTLFLIVDADGKLLNAAHGSLEANDRLKAKYESYDDKVASMEIRTVAAGILGTRALHIVVTTFKP